MQVIHSTRSRWSSPAMPISIRLTVQLPPMKSLHAARQAVLDHRQVDRIEDDHRVVLHAQRARGVDPVALPAGRAQLRIDLVGVVAALAGDDHRQLLQRLDVRGVRHRAGALADVRALAARLRGREEHRLDVVEVLLLAHPLHEDRAHHAAPTDDADSQHDRFPSSTAVPRPRTPSPRCLPSSCPQYICRRCGSRRAASSSPPLRAGPPRRPG